MKSTFEKTMLKISKGSNAGFFPVYFGYVDNDQCQIFFECFDMKICIVEDNFWDCLSRLKKQYPDILLHCKGYKRNAYPSRMLLQMGKAVKVYEYKLGKQATFEDLVFIFSPEDSELTSSVDEQIVFFNKWINSLDNK